MNKSVKKYEGYKNEVSHEDDKTHVHTWHFVREYDTFSPTPKLKFACECGGIKRVTQFEVRD